MDLKINIKEPFLIEESLDLFPTNKLIWLDYLVGGIFLLFVFFFFFHQDLYLTSLNSLNYLFGNPLDFYNNCQKLLGAGKEVAANYPPTLYIIYALWLYPFKILGLIKSADYLPIYLIYWVKILNSSLYLTTGIVFYKITQLYHQNKHWGIYSALIWLTTPLALFNLLIMSYYDIFYVFFTFLGFLYFLKQRIFLASLLFGVAITFKYFPLFVFFPLLIFFEKKLFRILLSTLIFSIPMLIIFFLYHHSPAYTEGVLHFSPIYRIYNSYLNTGGNQIYYVFALYIILIGIAYLLENNKENYKQLAAYIFLFSSIFPFLFIFWHPQWIIFITPTIVLTTCLLHKENKIKKLLFIDLVAMGFFIAYVVSIFPNAVDLIMFHPHLSNLSLTSLAPILPQPMSELFNLFNSYSTNVYFSLFWGYLLFQLIYKYKFINQTKINFSYNYSDVRTRFYVGLLIYIIPAMLTFYINYLNKNVFIIENVAVGKSFGELTSGRSFEQTFTAEKAYLKEVDLLLVTFSRINNQPFKLEILNESRNLLATITRTTSNIANNAWEPFKFSKVKLEKGRKYILRLSSNGSKVGDAITWWASNENHYKKGCAIVDGIPKNSSFSFKLKFV